MSQIIDPVPSNHDDRIHCCYVNATSSIQVVRITNVPNWYFERVAFPGQRLIFEALSGAQLEIHTGMMASAILSDKIPCEELSMTLASVPQDAPEVDAEVPALTSAD
jgi:hypothetical protein